MERKKAKGSTHPASASLQAHTRTKEPDLAIGLSPHGPNPEIDDSPMVKIKVRRGRTVHLAIESAPLQFVGTNHRSSNGDYVDGYVRPVKVAQPGTLIEVSAREAARLVAHGFAEISDTEIKRLHAEHGFVFNSELQRRPRTTEEARP